MWRFQRFDAFSGVLSERRFYKFWLYEFTMIHSLASWEMHRITIFTLCQTITTKLLLHAADLYFDYLAAEENMSPTLFISIIALAFTNSTIR